MWISAAPGTESNRPPESWKAEKYMTETELDKQIVEMPVSDSARLIWAVSILPSDSRFQQKG